MLTLIAVIFLIMLCLGGFGGGYYGGWAYGQPVGGVGLILLIILIVLILGGRL